MWLSLITLKASDNTRTKPTVLALAGFVNFRFRYRRVRSSFNSNDERPASESGPDLKGATNGGNIQGRVFLRSRSCGGFGRTGSNGILPLPIMQVLVSCPGHYLHPLEARRRAGYCGRGTCCHVPKDEIQSTAILQEMRRPSHEQSSDDRIGGRICSDGTDLEVPRGSAHQLCRNGFANAGWTSEVEGFSQRVWRLRRKRAGVTEEPKYLGTTAEMTAIGLVRTLHLARWNEYQRRKSEQICFDIARNLVQAGNKHAKERGLSNCKFQEGDASNLCELKHDTFDLVVSIFGDVRAKAI